MRHRFCPFVALLLSWPEASLVLFLIFVVAAITDFVDGYLARAWNQMTEIGRVLDPIADKAMVVIALGLLMALADLDPLIVIPATVILFREIFVSGLREALGDRATALKVTGMAKWKTAAQMTAIGGLLLAGTLPLLSLPATVLLWIAALLTAVTGWDYTKKAASVLAGKRI